MARERIRLAWAVSAGAFDPHAAGCLLGALWWRLGFFLALLLFRPFAWLALRVARLSHNQQLITDMQRTVARLAAYL